ncbi:MAG: AAA family ATPase [Deltaproteobacteria bacterium RIFOXYD12_FULL_50_9]|nr:MAG: AAA family ATPase [Deltaproteobacteria bacterium RIFOXYD12_FULL_50_9]
MTTKFANLPSQKELEKEISAYLSRKYGGNVQIISTHVVPQPETKDENPPQLPPGAKGFDFAITPEELVAYLDEYVVRQDEAKAILATKICTHFNRIRRALDQPELSSRNLGQIKSNVLIIGPTGVGKTFLIKLIAQRLGVPFVKGDATKFSETGYVGADVEDLVRDLVRQADNDLERAQYGIIYVDEIDKIASSQGRFGLDVSRTGVQRAFLKPMEETEVDLRVPHDPISQMEAIEHYRATGKRGGRVVNTKNILFIMSGAFAELEEIIRKRVQKQGMGFEGMVTSKSAGRHFLKQVRAEDLIQYGFESEFVGRLPVIAVLNDLSREDLFSILVHPNSSVVIGKKLDFRAYGIRILFEDEALAEIARLAEQEQTGARGLVSVMEKILLPFEKKLPSTDIEFLTVNREVVADPEAELVKLLTLEESREFHRLRYDVLAGIERQRLVEFILRARGDWLAGQDILPTPARLDLIARHSQEKEMDPKDTCELFIAFIREIWECAGNLSKKSGMQVTFSDEAIDLILSREPRNIEAIHNLCQGLAYALEYGLQLLNQKKGVSSLIIPAACIDAPEQYIDRLVSDSFK